jgi:fatty-acid desaturase
MLCKYRHIFGVEETGVHSIRILNLAVVDLLATLLVGALIAYYLKVNLYLTWVILLIVGIIVHRLFCVNSTINKFIFGKV